MNPQDWTRIFQSKIKTLDKKDKWCLEFDDEINPENPDSDWKTYIGTTVGRFHCTTCPRYWPSNKVKVIFHMRLEDGRGVVKVRPTRQSCNNCTNSDGERPNVDPENIKMLMENLMSEIRFMCYNEDVPRLNYKPDFVPVNNSHEPDHCEGCKLGICEK